MGEKRFGRFLKTIFILFLIAFIACGAVLFHLQTEQHERLQKQFYMHISSGELESANIVLNRIQSFWFKSNQWLQPQKLEELALHYQTEIQMRNFALKESKLAIVKMQSLDANPIVLTQLKQKLKNYQQQKEIIDQGIDFLFENRYSEAIELFKKAEKIVPNQAIDQLVQVTFLLQKNVVAKANKLQPDTFAQIKKIVSSVKYKDLGYITDYLQCRQNLFELSNSLERKELLQAAVLVKELDSKISKYPSLQKRYIVFHHRYAIQRDNQTIRSLEYEKREPEILAFYDKYYNQRSQYPVLNTHFEQYQKFLKKNLQRQFELGIDKFNAIKVFPDMFSKIRFYSQKDDEETTSSLIFARKNLLSAFSKLEKYRRSKYFRQNDLLSQGMIHQSFTCLGKTCYYLGHFHQAEKWLKRSSTKESRAYLALVYYQGYAVKNRDNLSSRIATSILKQKIPKSLRKQLLQSQINIYKRSRLSVKAEKQRLRILKEALALMPEKTLYYRDIGLIAKNLGDNKMAMKYLNLYLAKIQSLGKKDAKALDALLQLQNFYPLAKGSYWKYKVFKSSDQSIVSLSFKMIGQRGNYFYRKDSSGRKEKLFIEKGFICNSRSRILPTKLSINSKWQKPRYSTKVTGTYQKIRVEAGEFDCIEVTSTLIENTSSYVKEYYAGGIGLVKMIRYLNDKETYRRELQTYKVAEK